MRPGRIGALLAWTLLVAACGGDGGGDQKPLEAMPSVAPAEAAAETLGFSVDDDGWGFQNYPASGDAVFLVEDAIALFGDAAVCVETTGPCTPTPAAAEWIAMVAGSMAGGVCEGMTVSSADRFLVGADPATGALPFDADVQRRLARLFATQFLDDVIDATDEWRDRSIADIVTELQAALADPDHEQYTLGIYSSLGGHSVLPYAVDLDSAGVGVIHVYDPNWPGRERYIEVDTATNQWRFSYFSADQADDPEAWTGGNGTMDLTPLSVREAPFPEPFQGSGSGAGHLLAISSTERNWTLTRTGGSVVTGDDAMPGQSGVVAVTRGASGPSDVAGRDLVLVSWDRRASLTVERGEVQVSVMSRAGSASASITNGASVAFELPDELPAEPSTGLAVVVVSPDGAEASVRIASKTERVSFDAPDAATTKMSLGDDATTVTVVDDAGVTVTDVEVPRGDERADVEVTVDGAVERTKPAAITAAARSTAAAGTDSLVRHPRPDEGANVDGATTTAPAREIVSEPSAPDGRVDWDVVLADEPERVGDLDDEGCLRAWFADGSEMTMCVDGSGSWLGADGERLRWTAEDRPGELAFDFDDLMMPPVDDPDGGAIVREIPVPAELIDGLGDPVDAWIDDEGCNRARWADGSEGMGCSDSGGGWFMDADGTMYDFTDPGDLPGDLPGGSGGMPSDMSNPDRMETDPTTGCTKAFWNDGAYGEMCPGGSGYYVDPSGERFGFAEGSGTMPDDMRMPDDIRMPDDMRMPDDRSTP